MRACVRARAYERACERARVRANRSIPGGAPAAAHAPTRMAAIAIGSVSSAAPMLRATTKKSTFATSRSAVVRATLRAQGTHGQQGRKRRGLALRVCGG
jgi:hypothetical protein